VPAIRAISVPWELGSCPTPGRWKPFGSLIENAPAPEGSGGAGRPADRLRLAAMA